MSVILSAFDGRTFTRRDRQVFAAAVNNGGLADIDLDGSGGSDEHSPIGAAGKCTLDVGPRMRISFKINCDHSGCVKPTPKHTKTKVPS